MENLPLPAASGGGGDEDGTPESLNASINTFCEITSASQSEALFYLESHNYSLDSAVSTYLETTVSAAAAAAADTTVVDDRNPPAQLRLPSSQSDSDDSAADSPSASPSRSRSPSPTVASRRSQYNLRSKSTGVANSSRIRTLADLSRDDGSDSESDEPQGYYTGGEKSGMLVQDPSKANDVDAIFKQAREAGGIEGPAEHVNPSSSSRNFAGTARLLSGDTVTAAATPQQPEIVTHNIVFWSNGFSVDGGPLRRLDDPQNASFLESIRKSECPEELQPADRRTPVHVNLTRKEEKYPVPKKTRSPFKGVGRTLGSTSDPTDEQAATEVTSFTSAPAPSIGLIVDESLPSTSIQLRLADGTRMVLRFNLGHTVRDIRGFIDASRPRGSRLYQLQTVGFPPKVLNELDQTIEQAGLGNSVVIQKL